MILPILFYTITKKIGNLFNKLKDPIDKNAESNLIYRIPRKNSNGVYQKLFKK